MASPVAALLSFSINHFLLLLLLLLLISCTTPLPSHAFEFEVGEEFGWAVPPSNNTEMYNHWASRNRFQIGDTVHFRYKKDSVMVVSEEEEYESCGTTSHPAFFSNTGKTEFKLDRSGLFYFISGTAGHCERGQKMIIRVMSHPEEAEGPSGGTLSSHSSTPSSAVSSAAVPAAAPAGDIIGMASVEVFVLYLAASRFQFQ